MFRKLVSNLPFNPSLLETVSFYAKRVKQEQSLRRLGFGFFALAMFIQMFAVIAPPEPTLAESANDIIRGGFTEKDQAVLHCLNGDIDFSTILNHFGITCTDIANSDTRYLRSTEYGGQLYSMGRIARGPIGRSNKATDERTVTIQGHTYYMRKLASLDTYAYSTYKALVGTAANGRTFMILYDCGNLVIVGPPPAPTPPPPPPPAPTPDACPELPGSQSSPKQCMPCEDSSDENDIASCLQAGKLAKNDTQKIADANNTRAAAGDEITYTISIKNTSNRELKDFEFKEVLTDVLEYADLKEIGGATFNEKDQTLTWPKVSIGAGVTEQRSFSIKVKETIPQTPVSSSDPSSYDLTMTNVFYGTAVNIHLPPGIAKTTEQVVTTLPNTGPGTSIIIGFVITTVIAYFFARSKVMSDELEIIKSDFAQTGGL